MLTTSNGVGCNYLVTAWCTQGKIVYNAHATSLTKHLQLQASSTAGAAWLSAALVTSFGATNCTGTCFETVQHAASSIHQHNADVVGVMWAPAVEAGSPAAAQVAATAAANGAPRSSLVGAPEATSVCSPTVADYAAATLPQAPTLAPQAASVGDLQAPVLLYFASATASDGAAPSLWSMFDLMSCSVVRHGVELARDSGTAAMVALPWRLSGDGAATAQERGVLTLVPAYTYVARSPLLAAAVTVLTRHS